VFKIIKEDKVTKARVGLCETRRSLFNTPSFFPVATQATVKGLSPRELEEIGVEGLLVNAYHLYLRPGIETINRCGGVHKFMNFYKTVITDSGGYQIFSLERLRKVTEEGVEFQSHIDGRKIFLTPEEVVKIQLELNSDIVVPLDECIKYPHSWEDASKACARTIHWARRSKDFFQRNKQDGLLFFGIIQGATFLDLRKKCLDEIVKVGVDGLCFGGLSVGEPQGLRYNIISFLEKESDRSYIRYFMGYGKPGDILEAVSRGVDLFDCVIPTRFARTGTAYTNDGKIVVRNSLYKNEDRPLDSDCSCYVCKEFSRAYLHHLIGAREILGIQLLAYHNVFWYQNLMERIREAIKNERFVEFKKEFLSKFKDNNS
jgi:queuine tRNA-ribosyltransferase